MPITVHEDCNIKDEGINVVAKEAQFIKSKKNIPEFQ